MADADFKKLAGEFKKLVKELGVTKEDLQAIIDSGGDAASTKKAVDKARRLGAKVAKAVRENTVPEAERKRRIAALESRIEVLELIQATEPDFDKRMDAERELTRLRARRGVWTAQEVFHFEDLVDFEGDEINTLLREADKDIKARQNLRRVMKGIEVFLRVSAFSAALAGKIAASAAA